MSDRILIIEDDIELAELIRTHLIQLGFETVMAHNGHDGLTVGLDELWNLILLDLMLPGRSGFDILQNIRHAGITTPIIIITAFNSTEYIVDCFEFGANDYVVKPFHMEELIARIRNMLRIFRQQDQKNEEITTITVESLEINPDTRRVIRDAEAIELTPKEFDLLFYLAKHKNKVCSRENILNGVWGYDFMADTNVIDVFIRHLRQKIDKGRRNKLIRTVRGIGYCLQEPDFQMEPAFNLEFDS